MNPSALRAFFRVGMFITLLSLLLVLKLERGTADFVASVCALGTGATLLLLVGLASRLTSR